MELPLIKALKPALSLLCLVFLSSCFGFKADIELDRRGKVTMKLEYRIAESAESLGRLDGNEKWPVFPVGRGDFERSVARLEHVTLKSFSSKTEKGNLVNRVTLEARDMEALLPFLDAGGGGASLSRENGKNKLSLTLHRGGARDPELLSLVETVFDGYNAEISFRAEGAELSGGGVSGGSVVSRGNAVSFAMPVGDILSREEPLILEFTW
jgi:hypothetical protein